MSIKPKDLVKDINQPNLGPLESKINGNILKNLKKNQLSQSKIKLETEKLTNYVHFGLIIFISAINIGISALLRFNNLFFVNNSWPISFVFGYYSSVLILIIATFLLIKFKLFKKSPVYSIFIISGLYSNFVEKIIWGGVADYLTFINLNLNLADTQIFLGAIMINVEIWLKSNPKTKPDS